MTRSALAPILVFLAVSAAASPLLSWLQDVLGPDPEVLRLTVFSTAVGAGVAWLLWRDRLPFPPVVRTGLARPLAGAVLVTVLMAATLYGLARAQGAPWRPPAAGGTGAPLILFLSVQFLGAAAEEVGWRGLVQPLLETRMAASLAGLVTGLLFAVGHVYLALSISPVAFGLFVVGGVWVSMILAAFTVGRSAPARVLVAAVLHFLVNMATFFRFDDGDGGPRYFADLAVVLGAYGLVAVVILARRGTAPERLAGGSVADA
jgi:membrane protease YdiL (CAAX protease family)